MAEPAGAALVDRREQVLDPMTAYQITSMMEGVVQRGTATVVARGRQAGRRQDRHHQRREGRLVRRLHARPRRSASTSATTSRAISGAARPAATSRRRSCKDFLKVALADKPAVPFRVPPGIKLIRIDPKTGMRAGPGTEQAILEAFKPGTAPPDATRWSACGDDPDGRPIVRRAAPTPTARCARAPAGCTDSSFVAGLPAQAGRRALSTLQRPKWRQTMPWHPRRRRDSGNATMPDDNCR